MLGLFSVSHVTSVSMIEKMKLDTAWVRLPVGFFFQCFPRHRSSYRFTSLVTWSLAFLAER